MARTTGPLLSLGGLGAIAKTQVYSTWRGLPYVRQYVVPSNPRSAAQTLTRSVFSFLNAVWKLSPSLVQAAWTANARGRPYTDRNKFIGDNVKVLREADDLTGLILSPGANGGSVAASLDPVVDDDEITVTMVAPDLPTGWEVTNAIFALIRSVDPHEPVTPVIAVASDAMTPYTATFSGLAAGDYLVSGWFQFTKPNGTFAYGPSISEIAIVV